ncbi:unnamed protein product [Rhizoctonia solani]|uniref:Uncharacterized protein n=1 Tax=Rhizoctonia solani TaxID=456999 RepID=A0A8H3CV01_9AGAM|nr:unnamed protein product [Rhizoctonia solani]CAE6501464.1 unnamed protein product [Rhizoctonia solani]
MGHFNTQKKKVKTGKIPTYQLDIRDTPSNAEKDAKAAKKQRQRERREARYKLIKEIILEIVNERGLDAVLGIAANSQDPPQSIAATVPVPTQDPAEVDKILDDFINQLIEEDEKDLPGDADDAYEETEEASSGDDDSKSEPDSEFDPPAYEPIIFESIIGQLPDESITLTQPVDLSMPDALLELETSFAELSMEVPNYKSGEVEEPGGEYSFLQGSPGGSDRTSTPPLRQLLDSSMLSIDEGGISMDEGREAETRTGDNTPVSVGSDEPGHSQEASQRWGASFGECLPALQDLHLKKIALGQSPAQPFTDWLEFEFVKWMIERDISQGSREILLKLPIIASRAQLSFGSNYKLNKLLDELPLAGPKWDVKAVTITGDKIGPDNEPIVEKAELWYRDILGVIRELLGNHIYGMDLVFAPRQEFEDTEKTQRVYDEMWTGDWWLRLQTSGDFPDDATIIPVILASDATQLTNFGGGKQAYPVYITLGNIPKAIRRKPNTYGTLLLGYLPVPKLECFTAKAKTHQKERVFHQCMKEIVKPLEQAGRNGVAMECGDGHIRKCFPILAAYCADNPEQTQVACCKRNLCYRCTVGRDQRGEYIVSPDRHHVHTANAVTAQSHGRTTEFYVQNGLRPFGPPFWANLPHCNIHTTLTPDILHQLHKGVFKDHLMKWCLSLADKTEFDDRFKAMPEHSSLRHFKNKVSELSQTTGKEHREMEKVFLGVIAGLLPNGITAAARALLEFIYYAQLPTHTDMTISWLEHALADFHARKHVFIELGIREHFNINKLHAMMHYAIAIRELGALDGYNTESPERLHIDFAKRAYKATNRNDFVSQMVDYLERRERVFKFDAYLKWAIPEYGERDRRQIEASATKKSPGWHVAKQSPFKPASLLCLEPVFGVRWFEYALAEFSTKEFGREIQLNAWDALTIFPKATQYLQDDITLENGFTDIFHVSPHALMTRLLLERRGKRFDTVLIQKKRGDSSYGIKGIY